MKTLENLLTEEEVIFAQKLKELSISLENIKSLDRAVFAIKSANLITAIDNLITAIDIYEYHNK
jgi:hypothetical protein